MTGLKTGALQVVAQMRHLTMSKLLKLKGSLVEAGGVEPPSHP